MAAVRAVAPLEFVNGGGTGSLERTAREAAVTEVSRRLGAVRADAVRRLPRLHARGRRRCSRCPSCAAPGPASATALGGGYLASGPADRARLPRPHLPRGPAPRRAARARGEVQTPLLGRARRELAVGDRVYMRHAKAGELCERFASLHLLEGEDRRGGADVPRRGTMLAVSGGGARDRGGTLADGTAPEDAQARLEATLREVVETLAPIDRTPCSPGEREAAEWLGRAAARRAGAEVALEDEPSWGTFPPTGDGARAARRGRRARSCCAAARRRGGGALAAAASAAGIVDEAQNGPRVLRRARAPPAQHRQRRGTRARAEASPRLRPAWDTLVVLAHHDAPQTGVLFDQTLQRRVHELAPWLIERIKTPPPQWWVGLAGPLCTIAAATAAAAAGSRAGGARARRARHGARRRRVAQRDGSRRQRQPLWRRRRWSRSPSCCASVPPRVCACCSSPAAPRRRCRTACAPSSPATATSSTPERHVVREPRHGRLAAPGDARGRGAGVDGGATRARGCATCSPRTPSGLGVALQRGFRARASTDSVIPSRAGYADRDARVDHRLAQPRQLPPAERRAGEPRLRHGGRRGPSRARAGARPRRGRGGALQPHPHTSPASCSPARPQRSGAARPHDDLQVEDARVEEAQGVGAGHRVRRHARLARARGDLERRRCRAACARPGAPRRARPRARARIRASKSSAASSFVTPSRRAAGSSGTHVRGQRGRRPAQAAAIAEATRGPLPAARRRARRQRALSGRSRSGILPAMAARSEHRSWMSAGHEVRVSNPGKVFFPERGLTKLDLVNYYVECERGGRASPARAPDGDEALGRRRRGQAVLPEARARQRAGVAADGDRHVPERAPRPRARRPTTPPTSCGG